MNCEEIRKELADFVSGEADAAMINEIKNHLKACPDCSRELRQTKRLSEVLRSWKGIDPSPLMYGKLKTRMSASGFSWRKIFSLSTLRKAAFKFVEVAAIVAVTLLVSHQLQKPAPKARAAAALAPINFYLMEHQEAVAQTASAELSEQPTARIPVDRGDFLYYEFIDEYPSPARPGVILRGRPSQKDVKPPETPPGSKEQIITLEQARKAVGFPFVAPQRLHPGYILDSVRKIEDRKCLHLLYTNGIDTLSLFEQPANGEQGLGSKDFREYAVFRSVEPVPGQANGQSRVTILAWINNGVSLVLIGKGDLSQLMDAGQSVSSAETMNNEWPE
jgi:hypothetical protein